MGLKLFYFFSFISLNIINLSNNNQIIIPLKTINIPNPNINYIESLLQNQLYAEIELGSPKQKIYLSISTETESFSIESELINNYFYSHNESSTSINTNKKLSFYHERYKSGNIFTDIFYFLNTFDDNKKNNYNNISFNYIYELSEEYIINEKQYFIDKNKNLISGMIGLQLSKSYSSSSYFLDSLKNIGAINKKMWSLKYMNEKSFQTFLIIGENPYQNNDINNEEKRVNAYISGIDSYWYFLFSDIKTGNIKLNQERTAEYSPQLGVIIGIDEYKTYINNYFFSNLIEKNKCSQKSLKINKKTYLYYECDKNINLDNFEPLIFTHQEFSYNFILDKNDLFTDFNDKKYFLCIFLEKNTETYYYNDNEHWIFGNPFVKKYNFVFDHNSKLILFYENIYNNNQNNDKNNTFIVIIIIIIASFACILGIYLLIKIIYKPKRIQANELEDSFKYNSQKNAKNEVDLNSFYNSKYAYLGI